MEKLGVRMSFLTSLLWRGCFTQFKFDIGFMIAAVQSAQCFGAASVVSSRT